jgi:hypothetical protein
MKTRLRELNALLGIASSELFQSHDNQQYITEKKRQNDVNVKKTECPSAIRLKGIFIYRNA